MHVRQSDIFRIALFMNDCIHASVSMSAKEKPRMRDRAKDEHDNTGK